MKLGVFSFNTEYTMPADELARECEARGFESLWLPEHTHIPASRESQYPGGGELPEEYVHMSDPFIGLAGFPTTTAPGGTLLVTIAPIPMTAPAPITSGRPGLPCLMIAPAPT